MSSDPADYGQHDDTPSPEAQAAAQTEAADLKWLMADPRGRRFVQRLLERSGVFRSSFTGDALSTAFREGERNLGLRLIADVQTHAPEGLPDILTGKGPHEPRG